MNVQHAPARAELRAPVAIQAPRPPEIPFHPPEWLRPLIGPESDPPTLPLDRSGAIESHLESDALPPAARASYRAAATCLRGIEEIDAWDRSDREQQLEHCFDRVLEQLPDWAAHMPVTHLADLCCAVLRARPPLSFVERMLGHGELFVERPLDRDAHAEHFVRVLETAAANRKVGLPARQRFSRDIHLLASMVVQARHLHEHPSQQARIIEVCIGLLARPPADDYAADPAAVLEAVKLAFDSLLQTASAMPEAAPARAKALCALARCLIRPKSGQASSLFSLQPASRNYARFVRLALTALDAPCSSPQRARELLCATAHLIDRVPLIRIDGTGSGEFDEPPSLPTVNQCRDKVDKFLSLMQRCGPLAPSDVADMVVAFGSSVLMRGLLHKTLLPALDAMLESDPVQWRRAFGELIQLVHDRKVADDELRPLIDIIRKHAATEPGDACALLAVASLHRKALYELDRDLTGERVAWRSPQDMVIARFAALRAAGAHKLGRTLVACLQDFAGDEAQADVLAGALRGMRTPPGAALLAAAETVLHRPAMQEPLAGPRLGLATACLMLLVRWVEPASVDEWVTLWTHADVQPGPARIEAMWSLLGSEAVGVEHKLELATSLLRVQRRAPRDAAGLPTLAAAAEQLAAAVLLHWNGPGARTQRVDRVICEVGEGLLRQARSTLDAVQEAASVARIDHAAGEAEREAADTGPPRLRPPPLPPLPESPAARELRVQGALLGTIHCRLANCIPIAENPALAPLSHALFDGLLRMPVSEPVADALRRLVRGQMALATQRAPALPSRIDRWLRQPAGSRSGALAALAFTFYARQLNAGNLLSHLHKVLSLPVHDEPERRLQRVDMVLDLTLREGPEHRFPVGRHVVEALESMPLRRLRPGQLIPILSKLVRLQQDTPGGLARTLELGAAALVDWHRFARAVHQMPDAPQWLRNEVQRQIDVRRWDVEQGRWCEPMPGHALLG